MGYWTVMLVQMDGHMKNENRSICFTVNKNQFEVDETLWF